MIRQAAFPGLRQTRQCRADRDPRLEPDESRTARMGVRWDRRRPVADAAYSDDKDALPALRNAEVSSVQDGMLHVVSQPLEVGNDLPEDQPPREREDAFDVLRDKESRSLVPDDPNKLPIQQVSRVVDAAVSVRDAEPLTRKPTDDDVGIGYLRGRDSLDALEGYRVSEVESVRLYRVPPIVDRPHNVITRPFKAKVEAAGARK